MIKSLVELYRQLDLLQRRRWFRIVALVIALGAVIAYFGPLLVTSSSLHSQRELLYETLSGQSLARNDEHAVSIRDRGEVVLSDRVYGGETIKENARLFFDRDGVITGAALDRAVVLLLRDQEPTWAPRFLMEHTGTTLMLGLVAAGLLTLTVLLGLTFPFLITLVTTVFAVWVASLMSWAHPALPLSVAGIGLLSFAFVLLTRGLLVALSWPSQALSVAHTVVKEASRLKISVVFIGILLVVLPIIPLTLNDQQPLRYQLQTFINNSLFWTFYIAACMTLVLSCATVAFEIRDRQIWQLMSKPMSRFQYLLGKWIGVMSVNLIIIMVASISIFSFVQYLRELPAKDEYDRRAVEYEVLTARARTTPVYERMTSEQLRTRVEDTIRRDPELAALEEVPMSVRRGLRDKIEKDSLLRQRAVAPNQSRIYRFTGLETARELQTMLTLQYKFHILSSSEHERFPVLIQFNEDENEIYRDDYIPTITHFRQIPPSLIQEDGTLTVTLTNVYQPTDAQYRNAQGALSFDLDGFELLYQVDTFEGNFVRAMLIDWVRLAFLAMLGVAFSTFLSFPIACLAAFTFFIAGALGPYLAIANEQWHPPTWDFIQENWTHVGYVLLWLGKWFVKVVAIVLVFLLSAFGEYSPSVNLVEGRLITWGDVFWATVRLGILWCGLALMIGYLSFRRRELATYSGHG